jgi:hypothetical protein
LGLWSHFSIVGGIGVRGRGYGWSMAEAAEIDKALIRQEQIWGGLYGPPRAAEMVAEARQRLTDDPDAEIADVIHAVDPDDEIDAEEAGTYRPAVG